MSNYLLDELRTYESGYSDALAPFPQDADKSLAGEAALIRTPTIEELQMAHVSYIGSIHEMRNEIVNEIRARSFDTSVHSTVTRFGVGQYSNDKQSNGDVTEVDADRGHVDDSDVCCSWNVIRSASPTGTGSSSVPRPGADHERASCYTRAVSGTTDSDTPMRPIISPTTVLRPRACRALSTGLG